MSNVINFDFGTPVDMDRFVQAYNAEDKDRENVELYKATTKDGEIPEALLKLVTQEYEYTIQDFLKLYVPVVLKSTGIPEVQRKCIPYLKTYVSFLMKSGVRIFFCPTDKISKDVALLLTDGKFVDSIHIYLASKYLTKDHLMDLMTLLYHLSMYHNTIYNKSISIYAIPYNTKVEGLKAKKSDIEIHYLDDLKKVIVLHNKKYIIGTCKCRAGELEHLQVLHPCIFTNLKYLYKQIELGGEL